MMAGPYRRPVKKKLREWQGICLKLSLNSPVAVGLVSREKMQIFAGNRDTRALRATDSSVSRAKDGLPVNGPLSTSSNRAHGRRSREQRQAEKKAHAQKEEAAVSGGFNPFKDRCYYGFSWSEMNWNLVLRVEPIRFTVAMITTEMPAAMRPYSIAVAPDSSFRNATNFDITHSPCSWTPVRSHHLGDDGRTLPAAR
jgi:hypothetical protein